MTERAALWIATGLVASMSALSLVIVLNAQRHQNDALHSVICFSESFIRHSKRLTPEQKVRDIRIYDRILRVAHLAPC